MATCTITAGDLNMDDKGDSTEYYTKTLGFHHKDYCLLGCNTT
jgi:hypothetical protein